MGQLQAAPFGYHKLCFQHPFIVATIVQQREIENLARRGTHETFIA